MADARADDVINTAIQRSSSAKDRKLEVLSLSLSLFSFLLFSTQINPLLLTQRIAQHTLATMYIPSFQNIVTAGLTMSAALFKRKSPISYPPPGPSCLDTTAR